MIIIVRLAPKSNLEKIWDYVENHIINQETSKYVTPLYATQAEGMMSVAVVFEVKDPDNIAHFLVETLSKCNECHHTSTVSLMKPVFFRFRKRDRQRSIDISYVSIHIREITNPSMNIYLITSTPITCFPSTSRIVLGTKIS
jgi:hypothetical protein